MIIGVPKEIKRDEYRVAMLPVGVEELTRAGHRVLLQQGAGLGSGIPDELYLEHGAILVENAAAIFAEAELVVKVKEPLPSEWPLLRRGQVVFTYFHFAADRQLTEAMLASGCTAVAYETLRDDHGRLPLLTPMSEVAGRMSIQEGAKYLERPQMGRGILLGGVPGVAPANITILGGGVVGANAAKVAAGFGANIGLLDINMDRLRYLDDVMPPNVDCLFSDRHTIREQLRRTEEAALRICGRSTKPLFRPPFGARDERVRSVAAEEGYLTIYWTVDSWDSVKKDITPQMITDRVMRHIRPGAIVLMHCGSEATAQALPQLLNALDAQGYRVVKVSELLRSSNGEP